MCSSPHKSLTIRYSVSSEMYMYMYINVCVHVHTCIIWIICSAEWREKESLVRSPHTDCTSLAFFLYFSFFHYLNEELGRCTCSTRNNSKACVFCECECESAEHVLWKCSEYSSIREKFMMDFTEQLSSEVII